MNHSQFDQFMSELRAIRTVLERSAELAERLAAPAPDVAVPASIFETEAVRAALAKLKVADIAAEAKPATPTPSQGKKGRK